MDDDDSSSPMDSEGFEDFTPIVGCWPPTNPLEVDGTDINLQRFRETRGHPMEPTSNWPCLLPARYKAAFTIAVVAVVLVPTILGFVSKQDSSSRKYLWIPLENDETCDLLQFNETFEALKRQIPKAEMEDNKWCNTELMEFLCWEECECTNPLVGEPMDLDLWWQAFEKEKQRVQNATVAYPEGDVDVVFLGDSITEHWLGEDLGLPCAVCSDIPAVFEEIFTKQGGGMLNGVVAGIAAELCHNVLYRLQNGAFTKEFRPKVIWLLIGTNDVGGYACSVDSVVAGNIAIVEELQRQLPDSHIVVNGLLPRIPFLNRFLFEINDRLACYASMHEGIDFFNATDIFLFPNGTLIPGMSDSLHPTAVGHRKWGEAISDKILGIIGDKIN